MDYSTEVRQRFDAPSRAQEISQDVGDVVEGTAEDRSLSVWVRFQVRIEAGTIRQIRYRVFGGPHAVAAAESIAEALEGKPVDALLGIDAEAIALRLDVPREKFGVLLRMEDALAACHRQASEV